MPRAECNAVPPPQTDAPPALSRSAAHETTSGGDGTERVHGAPLSDIARLRSHATPRNMHATALDVSDKAACAPIRHNDAAALHERRIFPTAKRRPAHAEPQNDRLKQVRRRRGPSLDNIRQVIGIIDVCEPIQAREMQPEARRTVDNVSRCILNELTPQLQSASWTPDGLEAVVARATAPLGHGLGKLAGPLRTAPAGRTVTPSVFDMMLVIGREETPCAHR